MHVQPELPQQCVILVINVAICPGMVPRQEVPIQWQPRNGALVVHQLGGIPATSSSSEYQDMTWRVVQAIILMTSDHQLPVLLPATHQSPLNIIMVIIRSNEDRYI